MDFPQFDKEHQRPAASRDLAAGFLLTTGMRPLGEGGCFSLGLPAESCTFMQPIKQRKKEGPLLAENIAVYTENLKELMKQFMQLKSDFSKVWDAE